MNRWNYLNHAGVSPLPRRVADAVRRFADSFEQNAYLGEGNPFAEIEACRGGIARLIHADPGEIAFLKNTAEAISTVAFGLDWQPGDVVVSAACEYPANIYPWMELSRRYGVELVMVPERDRPDGARAVDLNELLAAAEHPRCRLIALSHVQYGSGQRMPLERIGAWCRAHGKFFCVDAIQSLGALPVDVHGMSIDFLAAGSQKWLLGPVGCAVLYVRKELMPQIRPLAIGAYSVVRPEPYHEIDYTLAQDHRRHESGTPPLPSILGLHAAVEMLLAIGTTAIESRVKTLTDRLVDGLRRRGCRVASPRDEDGWSGIVSFLPPGEQDLIAATRRLRAEKNIEILVRDRRLRAAPHFYNTFEQMDELAAAF